MQSECSLSCLFAQRLCFVYICLYIDYNLKYAQRYVFHLSLGLTLNLYPRNCCTGLESTPCVGVCLMFRRVRSSSPLVARHFFGIFFDFTADSGVPFALLLYGEMVVWLIPPFCWSCQCLTNKMEAHCRWLGCGMLYMLKWYFSLLMTDLMVVLCMWTTSQKLDL